MKQKTLTNLNENSQIDPTIYGKNQQDIENQYGRWTSDENLKYIRFLKLEKESFTKENLRRRNKVFKHLSQFIQTRSHTQCKSHHQKMLKIHQKIENIISSIQKKFLEARDLNKTIQLQTQQKLRICQTQQVLEYQGIQKKPQQHNIQNNKINIEEYLNL